MADFKQIKLITPRGIAIFPNITRPDTKFPKNGYPVYTGKLAIDSDAAGLAEFVAKCEALRDEKVAEVKAELSAAKQGAKLKTLKVAPITKPEVDKETGEETGRVIINPKLVSGGKKKDGSEFTQKPDVLDSKGKLISKPPAIYGGSTLKLGVQAFGYYNAKDNEVGVSFRLKAAQIIALAEKRESFAFGAEEGGYEADEDDGASDGFKDESGSPQSTPPVDENRNF